MAEEPTTTNAPRADGTPEEPVQPSGEPTGAVPETSTGRVWLAQLQGMIEDLAEQAAPVIREVGAKAAELAAAAGEKAGPVARRAAEITGDAGHKLAERSRDLAVELRRDQAARGEGGPVTTQDAGTGPAADAVQDDTKA